MGAGGANFKQTAVVARTRTVAGIEGRTYNSDVDTMTPIASRAVIRPGALASTAVLALSLLLTACGAPRASSNPFDGSGVPGGSASEDPIRVEVQNLSFNDVTIWAVRQGQRIRLGRVTGKTDESFRLAWNVAMPISFEIDEVGGRGCRTGQVLVEPNARVWLSIPSNVGIQPCRAGRS